MNCLDCKREMRPQGAAPDGCVRHKARGLCANCYRRRWRDGTLDEVPRPTRPAADLIEDAELLYDAGLGLRDALARLDIKRDTFHTALRRNGRLDLYRKLARREPDYSPNLRWKETA